MKFELNAVGLNLHRRTHNLIYFKLPFFHFVIQPGLWQEQWSMHFNILNLFFLFV